MISFLSIQTQPRILLILFKNTISNTYVLADQSSSFVLKHDNPFMDDPTKKRSLTKGSDVKGTKKTTWQPLRLQRLKL